MIATADIDHDMNACRRKLRAGLTLTEMLVVLTILAVLATVAVTMTEGMIEQGRFDVTKRGLEEIRTAILGPPNSSGQGVSGFVVDMGRLPAGGTEFFVKPAGAIAHTVQSFDSDGDTADDIFLASGWNGPYMRLGVGQSTLLDGWGNPYRFVSGASLEVRSLGADGNSAAPESGYDADLVLSIAPVEYRASTLTINFFELDASDNLTNPEVTGSEQIVLRMYAIPKGSTTAAIAERSITIPKSGEEYLYQSDADALWNGTLGTIAVRAIHLESDLVTIKKKSVPLYPTLTPGAVIQKNLILR